jgi:hypothetical protein
MTLRLIIPAIIVLFSANAANAARVALSIKSPMSIDAKLMSGHMQHHLFIDKNGLFYSDQAHTMVPQAFGIGMRGADFTMDVFLPEAAGSGLEPHHCELRVTIKNRGMVQRTLGEGMREGWVIYKDWDYKPVRYNCAERDLGRLMVEERIRKRVLKLQDSLTQMATRYPALAGYMRSLLGVIMDASEPAIQRSLAPFAEAVVATEQLLITLPLPANHFEASL